MTKSPGQSVMGFFRLQASHPYLLIRVDDGCVFFGLIETGGYAAATVLGMLYDVPLAMAFVSSPNGTWELDRE